MKVLLINGSPRKNGNTFTALSEIAKTLQSEGLETEIVWIGNKPIRGCIACGTCKTKAIRLACLLRSAQRRTPRYHATCVLLQRREPSEQTGCGCDDLPKRRCYSGFRGAPDAAPDDEYAAGYFAVLEHRLRS